MKFKFDEIEIDMNDKVEDWNVIKTQSYIPDRTSFVVDEFNKSFPHLKVNSFKDLSGVLSRSKALQQWYANINLTFVTKEKIPYGYNDVITTKENEVIVKEIEKYNVLLQEESKKKLLLQEKYLQDLKKIEEDINSRKEKLFLNKKLFVLTLNKMQLPLTILFSIENYTPKSADNELEARQYANELLFLYKKQLLIKLNEDPNLDIKSLVNSLSTK